MNHSTKTIDRGTIYFGNAYGYRRTEARKIRYRIGRDAQFAKAIRLTFTHKGFRKPSKQVLTRGQLVVLADWGHPNPPDVWAEGTPLGPREEDWGTITATMHSTRYPLGDIRWIMEFDTFLDDYLSRSGAQIIWDFREHDFKDDNARELYPEDLTPEMPVRVTGVARGEIVSIAGSPYIPSQEFPNLAEAQRVFPDLDLEGSSKRFFGPTVDTKRGQCHSRFDSTDVYERLSS